MVNYLFSDFGKFGRGNEVLFRKLRGFFAAPSTISLSTIDNIQPYIPGEIDDLISYISDDSKPSRRSKHSENIFNMHGLNRLKANLNLVKAGVKGNDLEFPKPITNSSIPRKAPELSRVEPQKSQNNLKFESKTNNRENLRKIPSKVENNPKRESPSRIPTKVEELARCKFAKSQIKIFPEKVTLEPQPSKCRFPAAKKAEAPIPELPNKTMKVQMEQTPREWKSHENPPRKPSHNTTVPATNPKNNSQPTNSPSKHSQNPVSVNLDGVIQKIQNSDWEICVQGLHELQNCAHQVDWTMNEKYMVIINRKLIDSIKSPRSNLSKCACQAAGIYLQAAKCTKRPEFDEIIDILLLKCADSNKFIQKDVNESLDNIIQVLSPSDAVKIVCAHAPGHRNNLVRAAAARLLSITCQIHKPEEFFGPHTPMKTRKIILSTLSKFLVDKAQGVRKYAEKCCGYLKKHPQFEENFYKETPVSSKAQVRKIIATIR